ncbi:MAG: NAD(P)-binding domain-containing protein [Candidatus Nanohaloarchaea archaeon]
MKDVIVIGGGVSGLQAAVFTAKAGEETLVLDNDQSLVYNTSNIQNLIGHESIGGHELLKRGRDKLEEFDGERKETEVTTVERSDEGFRVETEDGEYTAEYIVVASAGSHDFLDPLDIQFEEGVEGQYYMDQHLKTDESNRAGEQIYAAGLANSWEYQTSVAIGDGAKAAVNLLRDKYGEPYMDHDT